MTTYFFSQSALTISPATNSIWSPHQNISSTVVEASPVSSMAKELGFHWTKLLISCLQFLIRNIKPTPTENRECCKNMYNVKKTLLVKFNVDATDETDLLEETLRPRVESIGGTLEKVSLSDRL
ncbi:hypothetical protein M8C21_012011 [Ambrosia artemisiifolia]|uniref:Uncharacterized protein n=1 Tax=Ambrosia artemisiifolia TaxID=4212 RepID=A0AAD5CI79_AMBAR|nr:hypothetical protein M8C21_012011 [Ambrosia artemisiifolia]